MEGFDFKKTNGVIIFSPPLLFKCKEDPKHWLDMRVPPPNQWLGEMLICEALHFTSERIHD